MSNKECPRCGKALHSYMMSRFNTDEICMECVDREKAHSLYKDAYDAELAALQSGNYNFPGVGCPPELYIKKEGTDGTQQ